MTSIPGSVPTPTRVASSAHPGGPPPRPDQPAIRLDRTGEAVEVQVDPANLNDAVVSRGVMGGQAVGVAFVVFGVVALVVGIILRLAG